MTVRAMLLGAVAGTIAALAFTLLHGAMIADIRFMLAPMVIAGAICGLFLAWGYLLLVVERTVGGWLRYNGLYLILLFSLGPISLILFEPMITIPALLASPDGLPSELLREVAPFVSIYTVSISVIITQLYSHRWSTFPVVLAASAVLMLFLGLNIAPMGLVYLTSGWVPMLLELLLLILTLNLVYALTFVLLCQSWSRQSGRQIFST